MLSDSVLHDPLRRSGTTMGVILCLFLWANPAQAQTAATGDEAASVQQEERPAPYDGEFERLSEILGAVHYLRALCDAEVSSMRHRARMVNAFNRGYRGFQRTYSQCTENSRLLIDRYIREVSQIVSLIANRHGN